MRSLWSFLLILTFWSGVSTGETILFKFKGADVAKLNLDELQMKVKSTTLKVNELHEGAEIEYRGIPFYPLLRVIYGDRLSKADEVLFTCLDGYQPSIPLKRFEKHHALLTYEKTSGNYKFFDKSSNKEVPYGPFYMVWENLKDPILKPEGNEDWPYQLATVDLIQFSDRFPSIAPPPKASGQVIDGFIAYRSQCLQCHTINGEGGAKGIELNYPTSVTEYFNEKWLVKWISDPTSLRYNTTMPQVNITYPNRNQIINDIVAYLKVMAKNKKKP